MKTGIVRMVFRDFPLDIHPSAILAATASRCAAAQGQFWPMHEKLFSTHGVEWGGVPRRDRPVMIEFATELQLDSAAFERCLDDPAIAQAVQQDMENGGRAGVRATPNFLINGQILQGALPFAAFQNMIEQARGR